MSRSSETLKLRLNRINSGLVIIIYMVLKPIYTNQSGSLQICDYFMVAAIGLLLLKNRRILMSRNVLSLMRPLFWMVLYICAVNLIWFVAGRDHYQYFRYSLFYIYNAVVFVACLLICERIGLQKFMNAVRTGAFLSGLIVGAFMLLNYTSGRTSAMFNNPNQLGYYGVILVSFAISMRRRTFGIQELVILAVGVWCIIASLSKAAFLSLVVQLILCSFFMNEDMDTRMRIRQIVIILLLGAAVYLFFFTDLIQLPGLLKLHRMRTRVFNMFNENDTSLGLGRGYARIGEMGIHLLWGMGEGNFGRFDVMTGVEVHSTYASMIVCYGIIGFALYAFFLGKVIVAGKKPIRTMAVLSGVLLYSASHNGGRNTLVWMLFAVICSETLLENRRRKIPRMNGEMNT